MEDLLEGLGNGITPIGAILMLLFNPITILWVMNFVEEHWPNVPKEVDETANEIAQLLPKKDPHKRDPWDKMSSYRISRAMYRGLRRRR